MEIAGPRMIRIFMAISCVLSLVACVKLERATPLAIARCGTEVGATCAAGAKNWISHGERWAQGCMVSRIDFCAWCEGSGDPIFYPKGSRPKPSDCKDNGQRK